MDPKALSRLLSPALLPSAYLLTTCITTALPAQSQILVHATSWSLIALYFAFQTGFRSTWSDLRVLRPGSPTAWIAGALLAVSCVLGSVPLDDESVRWTRSLLPLAVHVMRKAGLGVDRDYTSLGSTEKLPANTTTLNSASLLAVLVLAAATILAPAHSRPEAVALGICSTAALALALVLLESTISSRGHGAESDASLWIPWAERDETREPKIFFRNLAAAVSLSCFGASVLLRESLTGSMATPPSLQHIFGGQFTLSERLFVHQWWTAIVAIVLQACCGMLLLAMVRII
jgi:hypothetical protein